MHTKRLALRDLDARDAEHLFRLNSDPEVLRYTGDRPFEDLEAARRWATDWRRDLPRGFGRWAIELHDGTWLGRCSLRHGNDGITLMGYRLLREHWGKGYASEVVGALLGMAFSRFARTAVCARIAVQNHGSRRVMEKNGGMLWEHYEEGPHGAYVVYRVDRRGVAAPYRSC